MAERLSTTEIQSESPSPNNPFDFLSRIPKFLSQAFGNNHTGNDNEKSAERGDGVEASGTKTKIQNVVRFRKNQSEVPPLKVENEDAEKDNRIILWQIYALGGFIVLKWAWGKWQERKANEKKDSSGEEQPPAPPSDEAANSPPAPLSDEAPDSTPPTEPILAED